MKPRLDVEVCVCTQCVMNGALDIADSVESLKKLKSQLRLKSNVHVDASRGICDKDKHDCSPLVIVDGERLEKMTSEMVMSKVISAMRKTD